MASKTVINTFNPIYVHEFSWTIENFTSTPSRLRSPDFFPIPDVYLKCYVEKTEITYDKKERTKYFALDFDLLCFKDNDIRVSSRITLRNINNVIVESSKQRSTKFSPRKLLFSCDFGHKRHLSKLWNLPEDKLIVKGKFSFSNYAIRSNVGSIMIAKPPPQDCGELIKIIKNMYKNGFACDIAFSVDGRNLPAHKSVISSRSPVFAKMFSIDMQEKNSNSVLIQDANFHAFNCFLLYLYTKMIEDKKWETVVTLYSLANKYEVGSLRQECSHILGKSITSESVCSILMLADLHGDTVLKESAKQFLQTHVLQVVGSTQWVEIVSTKPRLAQEVLGFTK